MKNFAAPTKKQPFQSGFVHVGRLLLCLTLCGGLPVCAASRDDQIAALKKEKAEAIFKVQDIVNQPVTHLKRTPDMVVKNFINWGHNNPATPAFDSVDVRATQELMFDGYQYVTSDLNPGEVFIGRELEFNEMTKYFYNTYSIPKKKLTEAEMLEINRLYRIIGSCIRQLDDLEDPEPPLAKFHLIITKHKPLVIILVGVLLMALYFMRRRSNLHAS